MKTLEELHLNKIVEFEFSDNSAKTVEQFAKVSSQITTDVAIQFAEFSSEYYDEDLTKNQWFDYSLNAKKKIISTQELFDYFINNVYGK